MRARGRTPQDQNGKREAPSPKESRTHLGLNPEIVNVNGGAIALGHPLGCSGARISTTLVHEMQKRDVQFGLASICIAGGLGMAMAFEKL